MRLLKSLSFQTALTVFLITFFFYFYSAARTITGFGDSDEIITISYLMGAAHPSGYPLTVMLTHLFMMLPLPVSIAFKAQIFSVFCHALALTIFYIGFFKLLKLLLPNLHAYWQAIFSFLTVSLVGTSGLFWLYAGVLEVNALNMVFFGILSTSFIYWSSYAGQKHLTKSELLFFCLMAVSAGLGLSNVHTFILLIPGTGIAISYTLQHFNRWSLYLRPLPIFLGLISLFCAWVIPNLGLFYLNSRQTNFSWFFDQSLIGWWNMILRRDYGGTILDQGGRQVSAYISFKGLREYSQSFIQYIGYLFQHYSWFSLLVGTIGISFGWKLNKFIYSAALGWWIIAGPLFATYMGFPSDPANLEYRTIIGIAHRQLILGEMTFGLLIILGIVYLISRFQFKYTLRASIIISFFVLIYQISSNFTFAVQRDYDFADYYGRRLLDSAESGGVIICFSDISCFSLFYLQEVVNYRPDVTVLIKNNLYQKYFLSRHPQYQSYLYGYNPFFTADLISWNASQRPTYLTEPDGYYIDHIGMDANPLYLIPEGTLFRVTDRIPQKLKTPDFELVDKLYKTRPSNKHYLATGLRDYFTQKNNAAAVIFAKTGDIETAQKLLMQSSLLSPRFKRTKEIESLLLTLSQDKRYQYGSVSPTSEQVFNQFKQEYEESQTTQDSQKLMNAYKTLLKAAYRDPQNTTIRIALAEIYLRFQYYNEAQIELLRILKFDPNHVQAKELLNQVIQSQSQQ